MSALPKVIEVPPAKTSVLVVKVLVFIDGVDLLTYASISTLWLAGSPVIVEAFEPFPPIVGLSNNVLGVNIALSVPIIQSLVFVKVSPPVDKLIEAWPEPFAVAVNLRWTANDISVIALGLGLLTGNNDVLLKGSFKTAFPFSNSTLKYSEVPVPTLLTFLKALKLVLRAQHSFVHQINDILIYYQNDLLI